MMLILVNGVHLAYMQLSLQDFRHQILKHLRIEDSPQSTMQAMELLRRMTINTRSSGQADVRKLKWGSRSFDDDLLILDHPKS